MTPLATYVVETIVTLVSIVLLAALVVYGARRVGVGDQRGAVQLIGRLPLEARRAVYLVKVGRVVYVLGASEAGLTKLGEVADADVELVLAAGTTPQQSFGSVLRRPTRGGGERQKDEGHAT